ncbi:MAG: TolC family protein [SAR324 cluster bacterium]|nr:TolC family protein [SAR324 cluster bacterium]
MTKRISSIKRFAQGVILWVLFLNVVAVQASTEQNSPVSLLTPETQWSEATRKIINLPTEQQASAIAEKPLSRELTVALIERRSPELQAAKARWQATLQQSSQLDALMDTLGVYGQYLSTPTGMGQSKAMISRQFPYPGVMTLQNRIIQEQVQVSTWQYEIMRRDLWIKAKKRYHEGQFLKERLGLLNQTLDLLENLHKTVRSFYSTGKSRLMDLLNVEIQIAQLKDDEQSVQENLAVLQVELNEMMNFPAKLQWEWMPHPALSEFDLKDQDVPEISQEYPELKIIKSQWNQMESMVILETEAITPQLSPDWALQSHTQATSMDKAALPIPTPSPVFGNRQAYLEEISYKRDAGKHEIEALTNQLTAQLHSTVRYLNQARRDLRIFQQTVLPKSREMVKSANSEYAVGKIELPGALQSQTNLLKVETEWFKSIQMLRDQILEYQKLMNITQAD